MSRMSKHHEELNDQGEGKCSVPMWGGGGPAGFCDRPAYGERPVCREIRYSDGSLHRTDGKYDGYVPGLACPAHGGPTYRAFMDGNAWCAVMPDFTNLQESPSGWGNTRADAAADLATSIYRDNNAKFLAATGQDPTP